MYLLGIQYLRNQYLRNTEKYGTEKTMYQDTFNEVLTE